MIENSINELTAAIKELTAELRAGRGAATEPAPEPEKPAKSGKGKAAEPPAEEETTQPTKAQVRKTLAAVGEEAAKSLLAEYGCSKLSELPEDKYAEVLRSAEKLS